MSFLWSKKSAEDKELDKANAIWKKKDGKGLTKKEIDEIERLMEKREKKRGR